MTLTKIAAFLVLVSLARSQQQTGTAAATGTCNVANSGTPGTVTITCGIGTEQGNQMITILNKILADHLDSTEVMKKLDEILNAINPNLPAKAYFCNGTWRTVGPSASAAMAVMVGGDGVPFKQIIAALNARQDAEALRLSKVQMQSEPGWLTPLLTSGVAYVRMGDLSRASDMLERFDRMTGPAYSEGACKQMSDLIRAATAAK